MGIFPPDQEEALVKVKVGLRPNGLAYDASHRLLLAAANVGIRRGRGSFTVSAVDVPTRAMIAGRPGAWREPAGWSSMRRALFLRQHR